MQHSRNTSLDRSPFKTGSTTSTAVFHSLFTQRNKLLLELMLYLIAFASAQKPKDRVAIQ